MCGSDSFLCITLFFFGSDLRLVESGLQTLTTVFSRVDGAESWAVVQELVIYICNVLDPNLEKEATGMCKIAVQYTVLLTTITY